MSHTISFRNDSGFSVPGFGVMRCTGTTSLAGRLSLTMQEPNDTFERWYYVNGPTPVPSGRFGQCRVLNAADAAAYPVLFAQGLGTPVPGESWGPASGEWSLRPQRYGFTIIGQPEGQRVFARQHEVIAVEGTLAADLFQHETTTVNVTGFGAGLGQQLVAHDCLLANDQFLLSSTPVIVTWLAGRWCVTGCLRAPLEMG
ncbi:MAG: hypothetical protein JNM18_01515 [Planctomycetaceae bacterium]|nr:hypothetical protein [Planctomycetaceae bacterium]